MVVGENQANRGGQLFANQIFALASFPIPIEVGRKVLIKIRSVVDQADNT